MRYDLIKHRLHQLYRKALIAITGLPRHSRLEELHRNAGLLMLADTIRARIEGATTIAFVTAGTQPTTSCR